MKTHALVCLCLALVRCDTASFEDEATTPSVMTFEILDEAAGFVLTTPGTEVIRDEGAWLGLWNTRWSLIEGDGTKTPPPAVDFSQKMVIAVFWGAGFSGCSNGVQAIETVIQRADEIVVVVGPLPNLGPCDALVYPIQMVQVDRSDLPIVFEGDVPR